MSKSTKKLLQDAFSDELELAKYFLVHKSSNRIVELNSLDVLSAYMEALEKLGYEIVGR